MRTQATQLEQYYGRNDAQIIWLKPERNSELVSALAGLTVIGVTNMDAALARIEMRKQALNSEDPSILALVELTFSATLVEAAQKLRLGQMHLYRDTLHPRTLQRFIYGDRVLALAASGEPITQLLTRLEPQTADYQAIRQKLIQYVAVQRNGGWPAITPGSDLKPGESGPRVADLRQRLQTTGYLPPSATPSDTFDEPLAAALRTFQRQHAIPATGNLDRRTLLALNVPVRDRIAQLTTNLERWRWFEDMPAGDVWIVNTNIPRLELQSPDGSRQAYALKVDSTCEQIPSFRFHHRPCRTRSVVHVPARHRRALCVACPAKQSERSGPEPHHLRRECLSRCRNGRLEALFANRFPHSRSPKSPARPV